jgi:16S rRNA (guanine966-N2)-methyltransferase
VIGGRLGGRSLSAPRGRGTRPTSDRVREALFSILGDVAGARVLDLYAGSGALAIEALSRGASEATLVDSSRAAVAAIRRNLSSLELGAEVRQQTVEAFIEAASRHGRQYDLAFADPPYRLAGSLRASGLEALLAPEARVVAESDRRAPVELETLELADERRYGDTLIRIYHAPSR